MEVSVNAIDMEYEFQHLRASTNPCAHSDWPPHADCHSRPQAGGAGLPAAPASHGRLQFWLPLMFGLCIIKLHSLVLSQLFPFIF